MKPHLWKHNGTWMCYLPNRPHKWAIGDTAADAYAALIARL